jgi:hypothetical protein
LQEHNLDILTSFIIHVRGGENIRGKIKKITMIGSKEKIATWVDGFSHMLPSMPKGEIVGIVVELVFDIHVLSLMSTYVFS